MAVPDRHHPRKLTYEDYLLIPDDRFRHEIIDGKHYVTASFFYRHQRALGELFGSLANFVKTHHLGVVVISPFDVLLSKHDVVIPDLLFVRKERMEVIGERYLEGAPDLTVEVLSKSTRHRDERLKLKRYELFGVQEYWLLDPVRKTARIYRQDGERLHLAAALSSAAGDALSSPLFPGLEVPLAEIFV
jgi:Uma2 family endonuclease